MARVAIIGGTLQGLEAAYLSLKAGMETIVIDKKENPIAKKISNNFLCTDVLKKEQNLIDELKRADFILPALENDEVLKVLNELALEHGLVLAFDLDSYNISSSKILSDKMIKENNISAPSYYPDCKAPYIAKPSSGSGSDDIHYFDNPSAVENFLRNIPDGKNWIVQECLSGRSFSIEIIGVPGNYRTYEITEIIVDEVYDCKRVYAPCDISLDLKNQLVNIALNLANILKLKGIMDVEVIDDKGILKVLEIDARIPSQTPTAVYHSSGINYVEELKDLFVDHCFKSQCINPRKHVSYEHIFVENGRASIQGEHIMVDAGPLDLKYNFCGADEVLTNYTPGAKSWKGTFINVADSEENLQKKRTNMFERIKLIQGEEELEIIDLSPWI